MPVSTRSTPRNGVAQQSHRKHTPYTRRSYTPVSPVGPVIGPKTMFTSLPVELRRMVYTELFTIDDPKRTSISMTDLHSPELCWVWQALEVSKEFRREGAEALFGNNVFTIPIATIDDGIYITHRQRSQFISGQDDEELVAALPLCMAGRAVVSRARHTKTKFVQRVYSRSSIPRGRPPLPSPYYSDLCSTHGPLFEVADAAIPRQSWNVLHLITHVRFEASSLAGLSSDPPLIYHVLQFAADTINSKMPNLISAELDVTSPLLYYLNTRFGSSTSRDYLIELRDMLKETPLSVKHFRVSAMTDLTPDHSRFRSHGMPPLPPPPPQLLGPAPNPPTTPQEKFEKHRASVLTICNYLQDSVKLLK